MNYIILLLIFLISWYSFAQGEGISSNTELNVQIFNSSNEYTVDFVLEPPYRASDEIYNTEYFWQTGECYCYPLDFYYNWVPYRRRTVSLEGEINLCINNGFGIGLSSPVTPICTGWPNASGEIFQIALYRVTVYVNEVYKTHFWYDNRNDRFPNNPCNLSGIFSNDISVRYDVNGNKLYYDDQHNSVYNPDPLAIGFEILKKGETLNWWEVMEAPFRVEGFQERYFAILNPPVRVNNSPYLTWAPPNVSASLDHYELQRSRNESNFGTIYSTSSGLSYTDYDVYWGSSGNTDLIQYRVLTVFEDNNLPNDFSNTQKLFASRWLAKENNVVTLADYEIYQNYPNPFNPSTVIEFNIPEDGFVTLKVYDILGREVTTLIEDYRNKGKNGVEFFAGNISGGVYFYEIKVNDFVDRGKMILMK